MIKIITCFSISFEFRVHKKKKKNAQNVENSEISENFKCPNSMTGNMINEITNVDQYTMIKSGWRLTFQKHIK